MGNREKLDQKEGKIGRLLDLRLRNYRICSPNQQIYVQKETFCTQNALILLRSSSKKERFYSGLSKKRRSISTDKPQILYRMTKREMYLYKITRIYQRNY